MTDLICNGVLDGGRRLPSICQLAGDLRLALAPSRSHTEIEAAGLIESSQPAGTRVPDGAPVIASIGHRSNN
ncbi:hypothetical protein [Micromonospora sp. NPDC048063]|uniref:hypothetical protein n=1 Tax=Micromonospora sp. NPDC048063 TaxID=3364256 RepID=UPI003720DB40